MTNHPKQADLWSSKHVYNDPHYQRTVYLELLGSNTRSRHVQWSEYNGQLDDVSGTKSDTE